MKVQSKTIPPIHLVTTDDETRRPLMDLWRADADADEMQVEVGIDADLLLRLAKAMGVWGPAKKGRVHKAQKVAPVVLTLVVKRPRDKDVMVNPRAVTKPIAVRPAVSANSVHEIGADLRARGVIMPMVNS